MLCHGSPQMLEDVPAVDGATTIRVGAADGERTGAAARDDHAVPPATATVRYELDPWPFAEAAVVVGCEARRLEGSFAGDEALRVALARAPWVPLRWELGPG
jgi:hypothetical protein